MRFWDLHFSSQPSWPQNGECISAKIMYLIGNENRINLAVFAELRNGLLVGDVLTFMRGC